MCGCDCVQAQLYLWKFVEWSSLMIFALNTNVTWLVDGICLYQCLLALCDRAVYFCHSLKWHWPRLCFDQLVREQDLGTSRHNFWEAVYALSHFLCLCHFNMQISKWRLFWHPCASGNCDMQLSSSYPVKRAITGEKRAVLLASRIYWVLYRTTLPK